MAWECGGRDKATCERLIERLTRWRTRLYCADDYAVYDVLLPAGQLHTGKDETHGIERDNARQRHWLARFRQRSIVVSKAKRMVDVMHCPVRSLRWKQKDRRSHIYANLRPSFYRLPLNDCFPPIGNWTVATLRQPGTHAFAEEHPATA